MKKYVLTTLIIALNHYLLLAQWTPLGNNIYSINGSIRGNQQGAIRVDTGNGVLDLGPQNLDYCHLQTDRPLFYFNKPITINGELTRYGGNNSLRIGSATSYVDVGPQNNSFCHFNTNVPEFYFNKPVSVQGRISSYGGDLQLAVNGVNQLTILQANGYVGLGITNPDAKLTVKGSIHANEIKVNLLPPINPPDYVFEPTYSLRTLMELETYIKNHRHLPEIPSAKEIEENGLKLGEMNMLLLKKIEELTLYILEQEKRIQKLESNK